MKSTLGKHSFSIKAKRRTWDNREIDRTWPNDVFVYAVEISYKYMRSIEEEV